MCQTPNLSHETMEAKTWVMVEKLPPSSLTYAITQASSPCLTSTSFICKTIALLEVYVVSKKPMIT